MRQACVKSMIGITANQLLATNMKELIEGEDYYRDGDFVVFTSDFHLRRGRCCGSGCRHCPFTPPHTKDANAVCTESVGNLSHDQ